MKYFLLFGSLFLFLTGCETQPETANVTDDLGRSVQVESPIDRVVSLAPSVTEIVFAAGGSQYLVGVTTADDYPPVVHELPRFSALPLHFETVVRLEPDLVLASDQVNTLNDAQTLADLQIPTAFFQVHEMDDILQAISKVGSLLDTGPRARETVEQLTRRIDLLEARMATVTARPNVLLLIGDETLYSFGGESYTREMIELAGGESATAGFDGTTALLNEEFVLSAGPDVIIGAFGEDYNVNHLVALHPTWDVVPAVQNGRVYSIDPNLILRPGPRIIDGTERIAELLHPHLFESLASSTERSTP